MATIERYLGPLLAAPAAWAERNGTAVATASEAWAARLADLHGFDRYAADDWDGLNAHAIPPELVASALELAERLQDAGVPTPACVVPGPDATVNFIWQHDGMTYEEVKVDRPNAAEYTLLRKGLPPVTHVLEW